MNALAGSKTLTHAEADSVVHHKRKESHPGIRSANPTQNNVFNNCGFDDFSRSSMLFT